MSDLVGPAGGWTEDAVAHLRSLGEDMEETRLLYASYRTRTKVLCPDCERVVARSTALSGHLCLVTELTLSRSRPPEVQRRAVRIPLLVWIDGPSEPEGLFTRETFAEMLAEGDEVPSETLATCPDHGMLTLDLDLLTTTKKRAVRATVVRRW